MGIIFTESSEEKGIMYNSYEFLNDRITEFLDIIERNINIIKKDPLKNISELRKDIDSFKEDIDIEYKPSAVSISDISSLKYTITKYRKHTENILDRYSKLRYKITAGGNYVHGILMRSKLYSKDINPEHYDIINRNVRLTFLALDWTEKVLMDLFNMIDQDLDLITILFTAYSKRKIFENTEDCTVNKEVDDVKLKVDIDIFESYNLNNLPDILYFSSPTRLNSKTISAKAPRGLFMSPYIGISSMFIFDRKIVSNHFNEILNKNNKELIKVSFNISYNEWNLPDNQLNKPLQKIHVHHNIPEFREIKTGVSKGFIYAIDVSSIKNELQLFTTEDANREVVYKGSNKLPIKQVIEHQIQWEISYKEDPNHDRGTFESKPLKESCFNIKKLNSYLENVSNKIKWFDNDTDNETSIFTESSKRNGNSRRYLYNEFIKYAKDINSKNKFQTNYDGNVFIKEYPFIPYSMRFFYRVANPELCVIKDNGMNLVFFQLSELKSINKDYNQLKEMMIFAATTKNFRVLNIKDNKVYIGIDQNKKIVLQQEVAKNFDSYLQTLIGRDDIL